MADWYPTRLSDLIPWHANFNAEAQATGGNFGLSVAQRAAIALDATNVALIVNYLEAVDAFKEAVTGFKDTVFNGALNTPLPAEPLIPTQLALPDGSEAAIEARTRLYAGIIRAHPSYTEQVGQDYGIVGAAPAPPGTPALVATALTQSQVRLVITKAGYSVVAVDSKRGTGQWEQIGISQLAEYIDARPPLTPNTPELREYRVQGLVGNTRSGPMSAISSAVTVP